MKSRQTLNIKLKPEHKIKFTLVQKYFLQLDAKIILFYYCFLSHYIVIFWQTAVISHSACWPTFHALSAECSIQSTRKSVRTQKFRYFHFSRQQYRFSALISLSFDESRMNNLVIDWPFVCVCVYVCGKQKKSELMRGLQTRCNT
jgi:hypothetical protein